MTGEHLLDVGQLRFRGVYCHELRVIGSEFMCGTSLHRQERAGLKNERSREASDKGEEAAGVDDARRCKKLRTYCSSPARKYLMAKCQAVLISFILGSFTAQYTTITLPT